MALDILSSTQTSNTNFYDIRKIGEHIRGFWAARKRALIKKWDFYYGDAQRWYLDKFEGETDEEYQLRCHSATIENHCGKTCDVLVSYLYGQPNSRGRTIVRVLDKDGNIIQAAQEFLSKNVWDFNNIDSFRIDIALMAVVTGMGCVHKEFIDRRTSMPFKDTADVADKIKYGTIRYDIYDTVDTMALPYIATDPLNQGLIYPRILGGVVRFFNVNNFSGVNLLDRILQRQYGTDEVLEIYSMDSFQRTLLVGGSTQIEKIFTADNKYKDVNVPFTIFRNYGDPMYIEGTSDLDQMIPLQSALNEMLNADKAVINYHSFPLLVLTGGAKLPPNFIRKVNSGLEMDKDQDVKYLTWNNVLDASAGFREDLRTQMTVVSGVSQLSRGNAKQIGQIRSGAALKTLFQADINAIALKIPHFREAEKNLALSTLRMWSVETGQSFVKPGEEIYIDVQFPADFVGIDELLKAQVEQIELADATLSIHQAIRNKNVDIISEKEVDKRYDEILKEKVDMATGGAPVISMREPGIPGEKMGAALKPIVPKAPQTSAQSAEDQKPVKP